LLALLCPALSLKHLLTRGKVISAALDESPRKRRQQKLPEEYYQLLG
jgi:hypothetical protein